MGSSCKKATATATTAYAKAEIRHVILIFVLSQYENNVEEVVRLVQVAGLKLMNAFRSARSFPPSITRQQQSLV